MALLRLIEKGEDRAGDAPASDDPGDEG
jgi:hypothetical protein